MNRRILDVETKIGGFTRKYPVEWEVICGLRNVQPERLHRICTLLTAEGLHELAAMLLYRAERMAMDEQQ